MKPGRPFLKQLKAFERHGNAVIGKPKAVDKTSSLRWQGKGSTLTFGANCKLRGVILDTESESRMAFGADTVIKGKIIVKTGSSISIGDRTFINRPCLFFASEHGKITIGEDCLFADVEVRTSDMHAIYDKQTDRRLNKGEDVTIGNRVWLASNVSILRGTRIGNGSVVGARSLVRGEIPEDVVAAGIPAQVVRTGIRWNRRMTPNDGELRKLIQNDQPKRIVSMVEAHMADFGLDLGNLPGYMTWYYARALLALGDNVGAKRAAEIVLQKDPESSSVKDFVASLDLAG